MKTQNSLKNFGFSGDAPVVNGTLTAANNRSPSPPPGSSSLSVDVPVTVESEEPILNWETNKPENNNVDGDRVTIRQETIEPTLQWDDPAVFVGSAADSVDDETRADLAGEVWEDELDENIGVAAIEIQGWEELWEQIKNDLAKGKKGGLPLSKVNQLLIICNFATLQLKGFSRMQASREIALQWYEGTGSGIHFASRVRSLARHYQLFEQLPKKMRGGKHNSRTLLADETTRKAARAWLNAQKVGDVTPEKFQMALNQTILPSLGITCERSLCLQTACRWLVTLGWQLTVLQKGVYFDGHERPDVVEYREKVFLPAMEKYERRMAKYIGPQLERIEPSLAPGEKEIIAEWHDESGFHALEYKSSAW